MPRVERVQGEEQPASEHVPPTADVERTYEEEEKERHGLVAREVEVLQALLDVVRKVGKDEPADEGARVGRGELTGEEISSPSGEDESQ